jgi:hypothetical protein
VKCYINNSVLLQSYIRNINKHFWCRCRGGSQYLLSIYRLYGITLASIISLTDLSATLCLFMVFTWSCMTGFDLPANYHSDPESSRCRVCCNKSCSRLSSPGSSRCRVQEIVDKFQGSPPPHESALMAAQRCQCQDWSRETSEMVVLNLNQLSSTWCSKAHSAARPWRMLMLIFNTSWRSVTHSLSDE